MPPLNRLSARAFAVWVEKYNQAGLSPLSTPPRQALNKAAQSQVIISSKLLRSIESAQALSAHEEKFSSEVFNEAELPVANWSGINFSPKIWAVLFRVAWLLGYSNNAESFSETKTRAVNAVNLLEDMASEHSSVLLVGHGVYNKMLANEMRARGWKGPGNPGIKHWDFASYKK